MLQLAQCKVPFDKDSPDFIRRKIAGLLRMSESEIGTYKIIKKSYDARHKPEIFIVYTIQFSCEREEQCWQKNRKNPNLSRVKKEIPLLSQIRPIDTTEKIIVTGAGPAGLFAAYYLSLCGLKPVLLERGKPMEERVRDVAKLWEDGVLNPESHVCFGEGGAGTFSDGKLNTGVKDRSGRKRFVLESFVRFGAGEDILYDAKPHIGTDVLRNVIVAMREEMKRQGCEFRFETKLVGIEKKENRIRAVCVEHGGVQEELPCDRLILAIGHSARDTFSMLKDCGIAMSQKAFAMGVRVQHRQEDIDRAQYGLLDSRLPASPYKCTGKTKDGRGVYSFCMCPGGYVVNASSEAGGLAVNGMSDVGRDSGYANSAIVVSVEPSDFPNEDCLAGVAFQRRYEKIAYELCQGKIPVQRYEDFRQDRLTTQYGRIEPCVKGRWDYGNLRKALPNFAVNGMIEGMEQFAKKIHGFQDGDTLLLGLESRTSSPVRIERAENFESLSLAGLYPCGEGAGYAGGIMSAAMDGLRIAMKLQELLRV